MTTIAKSRPLGPPSAIRRAIARGLFASAVGGLAVCGAEAPGLAIEAPEARGIAPGPLVSGSAGDPGPSSRRAESRKPDESSRPQDPPGRFSSSNPGDPVTPGDLPGRLVSSRPGESSAQLESSKSGESSKFGESAKSDERAGKKAGDSPERAEPVEVRASGGREEPRVIAEPEIRYVEPDRYATWLMAAGEDGKPMTFVVVGDKVAWSFKGAWKTKAMAAVASLNAAWRSGNLRSDHITPGKRGRTLVVRCDRETLLEVDDGFARAQGQKPAPLTLWAIDSLRDALGGLPLVAQVSRGGIPGVKARNAVASWYGGFFHGRTAADGSRFDKTDYTAASRTLPLGTLVLVQNPRNGKAALVRITDRGPYIRGRSIDLSQRTAQVLGIERAGVAGVRIYAFPSN